MKLVPIPAQMIDFAWADGASCLAEACQFSNGETTPDQLKMILSRGERILIRMDAEEEAVGWGVVRVDQLPNVRVLMVTNMTAHGARFERFFEELKVLARNLGCSRIRCCAKPSQARLYRMKAGFTPIYEVLEVST